MAINKKLIHFKTYQAFQTELEAGNILDTSIVWIKETQQIYTHGQFYDCSPGTDWSSQIGTNTYDSAHYISKETNLTDAAMQLDEEIKATNDNLAILNAASLKGVKLVGAAGNLTPQTGVVTIPDATTSSNGLMPAADKQKVDGILTDGDGTSFLANDGSYKEIPTELPADYAPSELVNAQLEPAAGDTFEIAIGKLHKATLDNEEVVAQAFVNFKNVLGVEDPNQEMPDLSDTNYLSGQTQFVSALKALDTAIAENGSGGETEVLILDYATDLNNGTGNTTAEVYQKILDAVTNKKPIFLYDNSAIRSVSAIDSSSEILFYITNTVPNESTLVIQSTVLSISSTDYSILTTSDEIEIYKSGDGTKFLADNGTYKTISSALSDDYAASTEVNAALEPKGGDTYEEAIGKLHKAILDNEGVIAKAFTNLQSVLGVENPGQVMPDLSDTNYLNGQTQFVAALKTLDSALKTVADQAATISALTDRVAALEAALTVKEVGA